MSGVNKAIIIGNLGRDPEVTYTNTGTAICKITVATTDKWTDKATGEKKERTEWHKITFFGKQAETIGRFMKKGSQIYIEGKIQTEQYEKNGETRYSTGIIGNNFQFIGSNKIDKKDISTNNMTPPGGFYPQQNGFQQPAPAQQEFTGNGFQNNNQPFQPPDDIPF